MTVDGDLPGRVLFHVGYHKTATSWLQQEYLGRHPSMRLVCDPLRPREDPFLRHLVEEPDRSFDAATCRQLLVRQVRRHAGSDELLPVVSAERLSGHPFSGGYDSVTLARRIRAAVPEAMVLCVVRSQDHLVESVYRQMIAAGDPRSFDELLQSPQWTAPGFRLDFFEFDRALTTYRSIFGDRHTCMLRFEELKADPERFVATICDFAGVAFLPPTRKASVVNRGANVPVLKVVRWLNRARRTERNPNAMVRLPDVCFRALLSLGVRLPPTRRRMLSDEEVQHVVRRFDASNRRLEALLPSAGGGQFPLPSDDRRSALTP